MQDHETLKLLQRVDEAAALVALSRASLHAFPSTTGGSENGDVMLDGFTMMLGDRAAAL
jgi:hypothetical protein